MIYTDDILIDRYLGGDARSFELLINRHMQGIFAVCFRLCQDSDDAHDITQNSCIQIMKHLSRFKKDAEFKTWAYRIAYNESLQFLRSQREYIDLDIVEPYLGKQDEYDIDQRDMEAQVRAGIDKLSLIDRSIVLFFYYDELKIRAIAEIMEMNENTIKTRLARAKSFLQPFFEPL